VARWTGAIDRGGYDAVGFTSTFEQNVASLALARAIKASFPRVATCTRSCSPPTRWLLLAVSPRQ
jgi:hypothetical protein